MPPSAHRTFARTGTSARPRSWSTRMIIGLSTFALVAVGIVPATTPAGATVPPERSNIASERDGPATLPEHSATDATWADTTGEALPGAVDLTLVTGDTVHVTTGADGRHNATVSPAPRPDGSSPGFWTHQHDEDFYVVPQDVADLVPQRLDPALFNVSGLMSHNLADEQSSSLPLIITYRPDAPVHDALMADALRGDAPIRAQSVPGIDEVRQLESINGVSLHIDKDSDTSAVRQALQQLSETPRPLAAGPFAGVEKIWLDHPIEAALDTSAGQIGAPEVWEQGHDGTGVTIAVFDTGIDTNHPDLAGQVVAAGNFSNSDSTDDRQGHGTHVAGTVAGTGAASDGQYTGVAPGADLINVKVLDDFGSGSTSDLIEGMEWAAQQGADIMNLSLGVRGMYTDGTDPGSMAVNAITEQYDTLVVISAGNDGPRAGTVTTPGAADLALTVGAVDADDHIASFSSRGPRVGDSAIKPDITAPGVDIVAAWAEGTFMGQPVNDHYTSESGTSMAAPHVAGAAGLLAQARPDLDAMQLKAVLMGTAAPNDDLGVTTQGAGRVDVAAALTGTVVADPVSVGFGDFEFPHDQREPLAREVSFNNLGEEPQTIELAVAAQNEAGQSTPDGALTLSVQTLTLPAGGSKTVTLTLDTTFPGEGHYSGAIVAQSGDRDVTRVPIGYHLEPEMYNLRVEGVARDGREALGRFRVLDVIDGSVTANRSWGDSDDESCTTDGYATNNCIRVPPGTYSISGLVFTMPEWAPSTQEPGQFGAYLNTTLVAEPEITIDSATTLTLDAREAVEVQIDTPAHDTARNVGSALQINFYRAPENGPAITDGLMFNPRTQLEDRLFMQPTEEVTHGQLAAYTKWQLEAPHITFEVTDPEVGEVHPHYYDQYWFSGNSWQFPMLEGSHQLPVVDAGTASPPDIDPLDLDGALALIRRSDDISIADQSNAAAAAGADMVAIYHDVPGPSSDPGPDQVELQVPTVRLSHAEGMSLRQATPVTVEATGQPASPYRYNLVYAEEGAIPDDLHYVAETSHLAAVDNTFHGQLDSGLSVTESWFTMQPWETFAMSFPIPSRGMPGTRTDYYLPGPDTTYDQRVTTPETSYNYLFPTPQQAQIHMEHGSETFQPGERVTRTWFEAPLRSGVWPTQPVQRVDDTLAVRMAAFVDGGGQIAEGATSWFEGGFTTQLRMFAEDALIMESEWSVNDHVAVPSDSENFRLEYEVDNASEWAELSTRTRSVWTFKAPPPPAGQTQIAPLLTVDYDIDVDLHNRLLAPSQRRGPHTLEFTVGHQTGAVQVPIRSDASLEVSYDSGDSWRMVPNLRQAKPGHFVANLPERTPMGDDTISLRIRAEDRDGNAIEQEIIRAYALSPR